jgi:hypothetical protein
VSFRFRTLPGDRRIWILEGRMSRADDRRDRNRLPFIRKIP